MSAPRIDDGQKGGICFTRAADTHENWKTKQGGSLWKKQTPHPSPFLSLPLCSTSGWFFLWTLAMMAPQSSWASGKKALIISVKKGFEDGSAHFH